MNDSHGVGTEFCGRCVYCNFDRGYSLISSGIGRTDEIHGIRRVSSDCVNLDNSTHEGAHCNYTDAVYRTCPKGWGSAHTYNSYQPGCRDGTYYPNPTPASTTDIHTGSMQLPLCREPVLINENPWLH